MIVVFNSFKLFSKHFKQNLTRHCIEELKWFSGFTCYVWSHQPIAKYRFFSVVLFLTQVPAHVCRKHTTEVPALGPLPPTWDSRRSFWIPVLVRPNIAQCNRLWRKTNGRSLPLGLFSLSLLSK